MLFEFLCSDREVRDEALNILMAGHETTANALAWACFLLSAHPAVQEAVREELHSVVGERSVTADDLPRLVGLDRVIRETLRLYPPAWIFGRTPLVPVEIGGYDIPMGANLLVIPYIIHRHPGRFPDPEAFRPERFAEEPGRYAYLPFGAGPRVCIGQTFAQLEMGLVLGTLLQRFRLHPVEGETVEPEPLMTLRPKGGLRLRVEPLRKEDHR